MCFHEAAQGGSSAHTRKTMGTCHLPHQASTFSRVPSLSLGHQQPLSMPEASNHCQPVKCGQMGPAMFPLAAGSCTCVPSL